MNEESLADELLVQLPYNRDVRWTADSLGLDGERFDAVARRVLELENAGAVDVINLSRDSTNGACRMNAIRFIRLED